MKPRPAPWEPLSPHMTKMSKQILFGEVWERKELSKRDRSLVTVAALTAMSRPALRGHIERALENGVTRQEIIETMEHLAFYCGWPTAAIGFQYAGEVFTELDKEEKEKKK